ncbi:nitroreductase family protein [Streptomyces lavendulae]|uniref:nitroreductase family protein n=1 Tax=Streptomyces lavendulae TaxID=1914 RepID=UPI0031E5AA54
MTTLTSVRRFQTTPVPDALIDFVLYHATRAGSGKNRQPWRFVIVRDPTRRRALADWYHATWTLIASTEPTPEDRPAVQVAAATELARNIAGAPVIAVACFIPTATNPATFSGGASVYPAIQNLLLTAHAVGLGSTLTTVHSDDRAPGACRRLCRLLKIPAPAIPAALLPLGFPADPRPTVLRRRPVDEVTFAEHWGNPWSSPPAAP